MKFVVLRRPPGRLYGRGYCPRPACGARGKAAQWSGSGPASLHQERDALHAMVVVVRHQPRLRLFEALTAELGLISAWTDTDAFAKMMPQRIGGSKADDGRDLVDAEAAQRQ